MMIVKHKHDLKHIYDTHKRKINVFYIVIFSVILSFFIGDPRTNNTIYTELEKHACYTLYAVNQLEPQGYSYMNGEYIALHQDPWFTSDSINKYLYNISLDFTQPLPQDTLIDIFYSNNGESFSQEKSVRFFAQKGDSMVTVSVNQYVEKFRLDIGNEKGQIVPNFEIRFNQPYLRNAVFQFCKNLVIIFGGLLFIYLVWPYLDDDKLRKINLRNCVAILSIVFLFLVVLKVNDSNMFSYSNVLPNNIAAIEPKVFGTSRSVRSDEWGVGVSEEFYRFYQPHMGIMSIPEAVVFYVNPCNWGYLFLPYDMAFSWSRMLPYVVTFMAIFYFFKIYMEESVLFPALGAFILTWAPESMWWNSITRYMQLFLVFDFIYLFFKTSNKWVKILCCFGLTVIIGMIIVTVYPAWHIPLAYLGIFLLIGTYLQQNKKIHFRKQDGIYILFTVIAICTVACCYFLSEKDAIELIANTVYPGKRISNGGGVPLNYFGHYLMALFMPFRNVNFANNSQVSSFISLFPIPHILYLTERKRLQKFRITNCIFAFSILCAIYMTIGFPNCVSQIMLFSRSTSVRVHTIFGLASAILLILEVYYLGKENGNNPEMEHKITSSFIIPVVIFFYYIYMQHKEIVEYLGVPLFCVLAVGVSVLGYISLSGKIKLLLIALAVVTVISGTTINPLVLGTDIMTKTPIAEKIREIDEQDAGNWITVDGDLWKAKYLKAQGVECLNALSYPPRFDLFSPLDPDEESIDIYNRYAHVGIYLCNQESSFDFVQFDWFNVNLNIDDMKKWNVKYVLSANQLELNDSVLFGELVYKDEFDSGYIYKIHYK